MRIIKLGLVEVVQVMHIVVHLGFYKRTPQVDDEQALEVALVDEVQALDE
jgi:hypothetical protein